MTDPLEPDTPYITAEAIRAAVTGLSATDGGDPPAYKITDSTLERFVSWFEGLVELAKGVAMTPRTASEMVTVGRSGRLLLTRRRVTEITAVAFDVGTAPDPEDVTIEDGWIVVLNSRGLWPSGTKVTISYVHGYPSPPAAVIDACIEFVRAEALQQAGSQPRNVTGERTDLGWIPEPTADPSKGRPTRWTVVNEALNQIPDERIPGIG